MIEPDTCAAAANLYHHLQYTVWKVDDGDSTSKQLALDFANGLVIVTVIGTMTFGIVLLYKYRCMKVLIGYMMFSSMTLLGVLGLRPVVADGASLPVREQIISPTQWWGRKRRVGDITYPALLGSVN